MKRLMLSSLSILLISAVTAPTVKAETTALNPTTSSRTTTEQLTPFNLVTLARRGYFQQQGIPSYLAFTTAYHFGQIPAFDIVQAAVEANRLSVDFLTNQEYLFAVEAQLQELENIN
jgi:hypothetical protein